MPHCITYLAKMFQVDILNIYQFNVKVSPRYIMLFMCANSKIVYLLLMY